MRYYVSWNTTGYYRKDSLKLAARCPVSGCWPSCWSSGSRPRLLFAEFYEELSIAVFKKLLTRDQSVVEKCMIFFECHHVHDIVREKK